MKLFLISCTSLVCACFVGCASERKEPNVNPAALDAQLYFIDSGMPIREVKKDQEFFFKKCSVDNRGPYPVKTNYDCNEP